MKLVMKARVFTHLDPIFTVFFPIGELNINTGTRSCELSVLTDPHNLPFVKLAGLTILLYWYVKNVGYIW